MGDVRKPLPERDGRPPLSRGHIAIAITALVLLLAGTGCSGSGDDEIVDPPTSSTTTRSLNTSTSSTATSTGSSTPEDEILNRYEGFWRARLEANGATPNPDDPALREFATGSQLDNVIAETRQRRDDGLALRAAVPSRTEHDARVVSATADRAEVQDCFVNDGVLYRVATGEVVDDSVVTRSVSAVMVQEGGVWKLERATVIQEWEGVSGCALAD